MSKPDLSPVLLQRADGSAEVKKLAPPFTGVMVTSEKGSIRTYRFVDFGYDEQGARWYTYVEDETCSLPVTSPSQEAQANDGEAVAESPAAGAGGDADQAAPAGGVDRTLPGAGEV